ncbi:endolytic transglycosylase MltG [uncultured Limosilactobacillus sp.]|uniref:endolytic transglycosylase MltG n=1 Tax=uncultured Limosilactobacillus sp. TaxID=2837629 RepID=UPI0025CE40A3|nr:endolytic transglycosylase MltG [uncultured Limosilactobacillus sp.]
MKLKHFSPTQLRRQNRIVLVVIVIMVAAALTVRQVFDHSLHPVDPTDHQRVEVVIPRGATDKQVATRLKDKGLIRSALVFDYYLQTHKSDGVKAGRFVLRRSMSTPQLVSRLQKTHYAHHR